MKDLWDEWKWLLAFWVGLPAIVILAMHVGDAVRGQPDAADWTAGVEVARDVCWLEIEPLEEDSSRLEILDAVDACAVAMMPIDVSAMPEDVADSWLDAAEAMYHVSSVAEGGTEAQLWVAVEDAADALWSVQQHEFV